MSSTVYLDPEAIPRCDFCGEDGKTIPAEYDFRTSFGFWANGCERHYRAYRGDRELGTGKGQRIVSSTEREVKA
jgi:hypothetical protein